MRHAILSSLIICGLAFGAEKAPKGGGISAGKTVNLGEEEESPSEGEGEDDTGGGPPEGSMKAAPPNEKGGAGTQHTVEKGDTLWDLSQKYLGSPWYWPKVWSYNPDIANPHWIYPGNVVRFFSSGEETPTQVELGNAPDMSPADQLDDDGVQVAGKIGYVPKGTLLYRAPGFVTTKEIEEAGVIAGSFDQNQFMSTNQQVYLKFKNSGTAKIGDRVVIFRPATLIEHPETGKTVGYLTLLHGVAKVVRTDGPLVTAAIVEAFDTIERGDMVAPYSEALTKRVAIKANERKLDGTIVAQVGSGTYTTVIVDQGSDQGVQPGNVFTVLRQQDGIVKEVVNHPEYRDEAYPTEEVGACIAWEVKTGATACLLVSALREIVIGDWVQMKPTQASAPPRASMR